jgi:kynurenine 3-monooxygenase
MTKQLNRNHPEKIVVIGLGLTGMMMALYLARQNYYVEICEKISHPNLHSITSRRGTLLDLSSRALLALSELNLLDKVLAKSISTSNRIITFQDQSQLRILHGYTPDDLIYNIARSDLYHVLLSAVENEPNIKLHFSHKLISIDKDNQLLSFENSKSGDIDIKKYAILLGCDGVNSVVRKLLNPQSVNTPAYSHLYQNIPLLPAFNTANLSSNSMYKWIGNNSSFLVHPALNQGFGGTLMLPAVPEQSNSKLSLFHYFPQLANIMDQSYEEWGEPAFSPIKSTQVQRQQADRILLLGDAAHTMLPFLGQGINCAFEDCRLFHQALKDNQYHWEMAIKYFVKKRQLDTDAILAMSEVEYQEFEPHYSIRKHQFFEFLNIQLNARYPHSYQSARYLLTFTHTPYSEIKMKQDRYRHLFTRLYRQFIKPENIHWPTVERELNCEDCIQ